MHEQLAHINAFLLDLDGTLTIDGVPIEGAVESLNWLKQHNYQLRICTNTTTKSKASMSKSLQKLGFPIDPGEIFSAPAAAVEYLRQHSLSRCFKLISENVSPDFSEFVDDTENPKHIVVGDIGESWDYSLMSKLFDWVMNGATIIALHKGRYWLAGGRLRLDIGAFVTGLEYASESQAIVIGKPSQHFFDSTLSSLQLPPTSVAMIGDDLVNDVKGAQDCGIMGILTRTGKYRQDGLAVAPVKPDLVIDSIAELPRLLA